VRHHHHPRHIPSPRARRLTERGSWAVRARVERFTEPAVLLLLREGPRHGYELLEQVAAMTGDPGKVDAGNLYRTLRALEEEGMVRSAWRADLPGPAKRTYELTVDGRVLLNRWADALRRTGQVIEGFIERYERHEGR
jgi:PadR family transcriptional regulator, regulatory protein PadR